MRAGKCAAGVANTLDSAGIKHQCWSAVYKSNGPQTLWQIRRWPDSGIGDGVTGDTGTSFVRSSDRGGLGRGTC